MPAPVRGAFVKRLGELLGEHKADVAELITIEAGKIRSESLGEVQEAIDICDFAVGLSRQLDGRTMPSERPGHRLMETWHPLGVVGVITAFNFPCAVWAWNAAVAFVCGDTIVWKPSPMTPLTSMACQALVERAASECGAPAGVQRLVIADPEASQALVDSPDVALVSATGSERMGAEVAPRVAARMGRCVARARREQRRDRGAFCRSGARPARNRLRRRGNRRPALHDLASGDRTRRGLRRARRRAARSVRAAPDRRPDAADGTLVGPLINERSYQGMVAALEQAQSDGGELIVGGGRREAAGYPDAYYVEPAIVRMPGQTELVRRETFAPILYVMTYGDLEEAIGIHNGVPQGLSSSIFTGDQREAELFLSSEGSDCGIVNVNIGTSGAEIGGAFGGEKSTGGGRESGSDAWRAYMRRATNTVNYSDELPLAQGVEFG